MAYTVIPPRVDGVDANAADDINDLMGNTDYFKDVITVVSGDVWIGSSAKFTGARTSILNTSGQSSDFAIVGGSSNSDSTAKLTRMGCAHYTNSEEPFATIVGSANATTNVLSVGGGTGTGNAATEINFYTAATSTTVTGTKQATIGSSGDAWFIGDVSALTFTDRTPFFEGDALEEIKKIKGKDGQIDHSTLPEFARVTKIKTEMIDDEEVETTEEHRDLGASISMNVVAIQQIINRLEALEG